jgi:hypothetical protein
MALIISREPQLVLGYRQTDGSILVGRTDSDSILIPAITGESERYVTAKEFYLSSEEPAGSTVMLRPHGLGAAPPDSQNVSEYALARGRTVIQNVSEYAHARGMTRPGTTVAQRRRLAEHTAAIGTAVGDIITAWGCHDQTGVAHECAALVYATITASFDVNVNLTPTMMVLTTGSALSRVDSRSEDYELRILDSMDEHYSRLMGAQDASQKNIADILGCLSLSAFAVAEVAHIDLLGVLTEVHASHMSNVAPNGRVLYNEDGHVRNGPTYQEPQLHQFLA